MTGPWSLWWAPGRLAWWIAVGFMRGFAFFIAGASRSLVPHVFGGERPMSVFAESCYCTGAVLYTASMRRVSFFIGSYLMLPEMFIQLRSQGRIAKM